VIFENKNPMKKSTFLLLGFVLGAAAGSVLTALCVFRLPVIRENFGSLEITFRIAFGRYFEQHLIFILISLGAAVGAAIGVSLAMSKQCFGIVMIFISGIAIGGTVMFFISEKVVKWESAAWEQNASAEKAFAYLQGLKAIDRGKTNQFYLIHFQENGRMVLTNYLREVENREVQVFGESNTNLPGYKAAKKYLAEHP
jgi:hypothetical protein